MTEESKIKQTARKTSSARYQEKQEADMAQITEMFKSVVLNLHNQTNTDATVEPKLIGLALQAVNEYKTISKALRVPTTPSLTIDNPWHLPPLNPRAIDLDEDESS